MTWNVFLLLCSWELPHAICLFNGWQNSGDIAAFIARGEHCSLQMRFVDSASKLTIQAAEGRFRRTSSTCSFTWKSPVCLCVSVSLALLENRLGCMFKQMLQLMSQNVGMWHCMKNLWLCLKPEVAAVHIFMMRSQIVGWAAVAKWAYKQVSLTYPYFCLYQSAEQPNTTCVS